MQQSEPKLRSKFRVALLYIPPRAPEELDEAGPILVEGHASLSRESIEVSVNSEIEPRTIVGDVMSHSLSKPLPIGSKWDTQMLGLCIIQALVVQSIPGIVYISCGGPPPQGSRRSFLSRPPRTVWLPFGVNGGLLEMKHGKLKYFQEYKQAEKDSNPSVEGGGRRTIVGLCVYFGMFRLPLHSEYVGLFCKGAQLVWAGGGGLRPWAYTPRAAKSPEEVRIYIEPARWLSHSLGDKSWHVSKRRLLRATNPKTCQQAPSSLPTRDFLVSVVTGTNKTAFRRWQIAMPPKTFMLCTEGTATWNRRHAKG